MSLRVIGDESEPLSRDELKAHGDALLSDIGKKTLEAMRASARPEFIVARSVSLREVRHIHRLAKEAATAWRDAEALLAELLHEADKTKATQ